MNLTKDITFSPDNLTKNSFVIINYSGKFKKNTRVFIEYSYEKFENNLNNYKSKEMIKTVDNNFYVLLYLEDIGDLYIRFKNKRRETNNENSNYFTLHVSDSQSTNVSVSDLSNIIPEDIPATENIVYQNVSLESPIQQELALVPVKEHHLGVPRKGLRFSYKLNKRIRLILYKLFRSLPNFITGNYRRRINL